MSRSTETNTADLRHAGEIPQPATTLADLEQVPLVPQWTGKSDYRIAMIGIGNVANSLHLPAYRAAGFNVVAAADVSPAALKRARSAWGIERTYGSYVELLERERPDIVDVTIHDRWPDEKVRAVRAAAAAGAHVLIQKPLAPAFDQCAAMVAAAKQGGIKMAVNHIARWAPAFYAGRQVARSGVLGDLLMVNLEFRNLQRERPMLYTFCVHSFDLLRWWVGREPETIFAARSYPESGQRFVTATADFGSSTLATVWDDWMTFRNEWWRFRIVGTAGMLVATEQWNSTMEPPSMEVQLADSPTRIFRPRFAQRYQPSGFIGSMRDLMSAIERDAAPVVSGEDNLNTMRMVIGAHVSVARRAAVEVCSVGAGAAVS